MSGNWVVHSGCGGKGDINLKPDTGMLRDILPGLSEKESARLMVAADGSCDRAVEFYFNGFLENTKELSFGETSENEICFAGTNENDFTDLVSGNGSNSIKLLRPKTIPKKIKETKFRKAVAHSSLDPSKAKSQAAKHTRHLLSLPERQTRVFEPGPVFPCSSTSILPPDDLDIFSRIHAEYTRRCIEAENLLTSQVSQLKHEHLVKVYIRS